ncbi:glucosylceramidase [Flavobacterium sp. HXWNR69]|uniref:Glucosylceramidase n=1 Tax=Flavobacterium fragile TaxID=2949085 RepID=A0ABT0TGG2_9FLAO|nr:glycoside hydrolase family 30 beta sandwich domain-containing protein [Flavobacterium sp. HXWNR69]MCL9770061.1 glucosylceramidase [Flavobacterium sp. HXWNR69]
MIYIFLPVTLSVSCSTQNISSKTKNVDVWITKADESVKLHKQTLNLKFGINNNSYPSIEIDTSKTFQSIDGFGYTLTGGSVEVINQLVPEKKKQLLQELFGNSTQSIAINYLRLSIGASDLNARVFSYNDIPEGETDVTLSKFSLKPDEELIKMVQEILVINPNIKIIATPWSPPIWMKDNNSSIGGKLQPKYYNVYAQYFVKYIKKMQSLGITIDAITPQNEPLHAGNNPSLSMSATEQTDFIKNHLGPAFRDANIKTKIIAYDHNCNKPEYPLEVLNDPIANSFVDGSAFHLYEGDISALSVLHDAHPTKNVYFTEQWTGSDGTFSGDLIWHMKNVIIGSMLNWSKTALEWNLANDVNFGPHTPGGCTQCKGAITIENSQTFKRNVGYYIIAHASKFVPANSVRIASKQISNLPNVAFKTPDRKTVVIVLNENSTSENFNIKINDKSVSTSLDGRTVATYVF